MPLLEIEPRFPKRPARSLVTTDYAIPAFETEIDLNTLRTGDANLRFYITTAQDGRGKSAFLTLAYFPCTIQLNL